MSVEASEAPISDSDAAKLLIVVGSAGTVANAFWTPAAAIKLNQRVTV